MACPDDVDAHSTAPAPVAIPRDRPQDIEMAADDSAARHALPPRLAARFNRVSATYRRASVPSISRRNSASSIHSNLTVHGAPHGDPMAPHIRRNLILESRKARLADRAAHVEKVRLRAALAKNGTKTAAIKEERARTAQKTRERLLADITAKCEEEVRRAKKKAEDTEERKAAQRARLRLEMVEKFAEAERRRQLYQETPRRRRTSSIPTVPAAPAAEGISVIGGGGAGGHTKPAAIRLTPAAAAHVIQRVWRNHRSRVLVGKYLGLNLTLERIGLLGFERTGALVASETTLDVTAAMLRLCGLQDTQGGALGERGAVRIFLSSYVIAAFPEHVLSSDGEQEQDLIAKARELLVIFQNLLDKIAVRGLANVSLSPNMLSLSEAYNMFVSAFHAWKSRDSTVLIEIMVAQFTELELIWQTVKNDRAGGVADDYQQGIRYNQTLLLARLKRLVGSEKAMKLIKKSLKKAKTTKQTNVATENTIPRAVDKPSASAEALAESSKPPFEEMLHYATANLPESRLEEESISPQDRLTRVLTALPNNRTLVHELLINRDYRIEQDHYTQVRRQIMNHVCDIMRREVAAGYGTKWTVALATVIQDRLLRFLRQGNSLHNLITEVLDPTHIEKQCNSGTFSYDTFFDFMGNILSKLCAPFRDAVVEEFAKDKSGDEIDRLSRLMGIIDLLSLDHTNFMLQVVSPQLIEEAPQYEQRLFERDLQNGSITLDSTREFWKSNLAMFGATDSQPVMGKIYAQGMVDLVLSNTATSQRRIPETLHADYARLGQLRSQGFKIAATASILLTAKNLLKRDVRSQWKSEADRILSLDWQDIKAERIQSIIDSTHPMPTAARSQLLSTIKRVVGPALVAANAASALAPPSLSVTTTFQSFTVRPSSAPSDAGSDPSGNPISFTDPVARLMLTRLRSHILARLSATNTRERVKMTTTASQGLASAGMPEFVSEVGKIVETLDKVREVDWLCHGLVHEKIWHEISASP
ncbi:IQ calmodulin-binding motif domain-containing protein [Trichophyton interdigitale]|nr:IQ calmodulin-binding motif domain-containing protein [Trichophyton interdigitale]